MRYSARAMARTMMSRLRLRAIKCPGCGAQLAFDSTAATVTCDYCQQVSQVVRSHAKAPSPPPPVHQRAPALRPPPLVQPKVQALPIFVGLLGIVLVAGISSAVVWSAQRSLSGQQAQAVSAVNAERQAPASSPQLAELPDPRFNEPQAPSPKTRKKSKANKRSKAKSSVRKGSKPNPYDVARSIKPAVVSCLSRDLQTPRFPVWYSSTISLTVQNGAFKKVRVSAKANETDLSRVTFRNDRSKEVTQADLDQAKSRFISCVKKGIGKIKLSSNPKLSRASGKVRFSMSHDGVPYGI